MWYVSRIDRVDVAREDGANLYLLSLVRKCAGMYDITFTNSETGETVSVNSAYASEINRFVEEYDPYGVVWWPSWSKNTDLRHRLLLSVDSMSMSFLDCVDSVDNVYVESPHNPIWPELIQNSNVRYDAADELGSLILVNPVLLARRAPSTLFNAVCYAPSLWWHNQFYLFSSRDSQTGVWCLKVTFSDIEKARALIAKATVMRYNPLEGYIKTL